jgi:hypothetical protein
MNILDVISPSKASPLGGEDDEVDVEFRFAPLHATPNAAIRRIARKIAGWGD